MAKAQLDASWRGATVSEGTLREQNLIPAFLDVLRDGDPAGYAQVVMGSSFPSYAQEDEDSEWWTSEEAGWLLDSLFDALEEIAPDGCTFGAHEGDGALFGFWPIDESF